MRDVTIERSFNYRGRHVPVAALKELYTTPTSGEVLFSAHSIPVPPVGDLGLQHQYERRCRAHRTIPGIRLDVAYNPNLDGVFPTQMTAGERTFRPGQEKGFLGELKKLVPNKSTLEIFATMQPHLLGIDLLGTPDGMAARLAYLRKSLDHLALGGLYPVRMNFNFAGYFSYGPRLNEVSVSVDSKNRGGEVRLRADGSRDFLDNMPVMAWYEALEERYAANSTSSILTAA